MTYVPIHAGDLALWRKRKGEPERVHVLRRTAKRVHIIARRGAAYVARYVKAEHLERLGGGDC